MSQPSYSTLDLAHALAAARVDMSRRRDFSLDGLVEAARWVAGSSAARVSLAVCFQDGRSRMVELGRHGTSGSDGGPTAGQGDIVVVATVRERPGAKAQVAVERFRAGKLHGAAARSPAVVEISDGFVHSSYFAAGVDVSVMVESPPNSLSPSARGRSPNEVGILPAAGHRELLSLVRLAESRGEAVSFDPPGMGIRLFKPGGRTPYRITDVPDVEDVEQEDGTVLVVPVGRQGPPFVHAEKGWISGRSPGGPARGLRVRDAAGARSFEGGILPRGRATPVARRRRGRPGHGGVLGPDRASVQLIDIPLGVAARQRAFSASFVANGRAGRITRNYGAPALPEPEGGPG